MTGMRHAQTLAEMEADGAQLTSIEGVGAALLLGQGSVADCWGGPVTWTAWRSVEDPGNVHVRYSEQPFDLARAWVRLVCTAWPPRTILCGCQLFDSGEFESIHMIL